MRDLRFTLLSDGSSDEALIPILRWLLRRHGVGRAIQATWADLRQLPRPPKSLPERVRVSLDLFPSDLLFIHRDAERLSHAIRKDEVLQGLTTAQDGALVICVIPVRMKEAWLLFDEPAIRNAAGNPKGRERLELPEIRDLERIPDPKVTLYNLLKQASGLSGRRLRKFPLQTGARRVVDFVHDFSPLLGLAAFQELDHDVRDMVGDQHWVDS